MAAPEVKTAIYAFCLQENATEEWVREQQYRIRMHLDWRLRGIYIATEKNREQTINRLISDCALGNVNMIISQSVTHFGDNMRACMDTLQVLFRLGVSISFLEEKISTDGGFTYDVLSMLQTISKEMQFGRILSEKPEIDYKTQAQNRKNSETGIYGYRVQQSGTWEVYGDEAEKVVSIFQMACCGWTYQRMLNHIEMMERFRPTVKRWDKSVISRIMKRIDYTGSYTKYGVMNVQQQNGFYESIRKQKISMRPVQIIQNHHPALVSCRIFDAIQALRKEKTYTSFDIKYSKEHFELLETVMKLAIAEWGEKNLEQYR